MSFLFGFPENLKRWSADEVTQDSGMIRGEKKRKEKKKESQSSKMASQDMKFYFPVRRKHGVTPPDEPRFVDREPGLILVF